MIAQYQKEKKVPYSQVKNMEVVPESMDEFPAAEIPARKSSRNKKEPSRLTYMASTPITDHKSFAYHARLDLHNQQYGIYDTEDSLMWDIDEIIEHKVQEKGEHIYIKLKVRWKMMRSHGKLLIISKIMT